MDYSVFIAAGVLLVALGTLHINSNARLLSIREYETYNSFLIRELDNIKENIVRLENTRPTTGELEARFYRIGNETKH